MEISYAHSKIRKICTDARIAQKELGKRATLVLQERLYQMRDAESLEDLRLLPGRYHELKGERKGERKGQLACSLTDQLRLVFTPANDPLPTKPDGGLDWSEVTAVMNVEIVDYH